MTDDYDFNIKHLTKRLEVPEKFGFYTMDAFHNAMLNEYKFNFQNNPESKIIIQHIYSSQSAGTDIPQVITTEFFPQTRLQAKSMEKFSSRLLMQMAKTTKPDYVVSIYVMSDDTNRQYIYSAASSYDGEFRIKAFEVIRNGEIQFEETDMFNSEYVDFTYMNPKEQEKKEEFDAKKREMSGV